MIIAEYPYNGRKDRIRHYSDSRFIIRQNETGNEYGEAIDVYPCPYAYSETDIPIENDDITLDEYNDALQTVADYESQNN